MGSYGGIELWFLAAVGDVYFQKGLYSKAHECFDQARGNLSAEGYGNPFIMLRLGACCLEIGDVENAKEYLLRAYMMEGKEIFEPDEDGNDDGQKYYDFCAAPVRMIKGFPLKFALYMDRCCDISFIILILTI